MSDKVVDASTIAAVVFREPREAAVRARLNGRRLFAPFLLAYELANVCWVKMKRNPDARATILEQFIDSRRVPIELTDVDFPQMVELALRHDLTAYDASYLWLARQLGAELVTLDEKLERAATAL